MATIAPYAPDAERPSISDDGPTELDSEEVETHRPMVQDCDRAVVVAAGSKLVRSAKVAVALAGVSLHAGD
jgi:DeoR/GlpR family transcriptional regulator of sugar metabolism